MTDSETTLDEISEQPHGEMVEVNWEQVSLEELKRGYMRQSDYTRKTQEIAELKKQSAPQTESEDDEAATREYLRKMGVVLKDDLETIDRKRQNESELQDILRNMPELSSQSEAIRRLSEVEGVSPSEVVSKYGFASKEKLERAKTAQYPMWANRKEKQEVSIEDMTPAQYEKRKAESGKFTRGV